MSHVIELTGKPYETLRQVAARDQETPEQFLARMVDALSKAQGIIYSTDEELLHALGADDEELAEFGPVRNDRPPLTPLSIVLAAVVAPLRGIIRSEHAFTLCLTL